MDNLKHPRASSAVDHRASNCPVYAPEMTELMERCPTVPSLPAAYLRLRQVMNDPYTSSADFARVIEEDAGLTVRVLRLVNSAMYGVGTKVDSVVQAMSILGVEPLNNLVLATSAVSAFDDISADLVDMKEFWRHSLGTAVAARAIGAHCRFVNLEPLFVAGLLHDVGRLMIHIANPDGSRLSQAHAYETGCLLYDAEFDEMGYDHAQVGRYLLDEWGLPASLTEPVGFHHNPANAGSHVTETAIVHIADITAHALHLGASGEFLVPPVSEFAWGRIAADDLGNSHLLGEIAMQYQLAVRAILQ